MILTESKLRELTAGATIQNEARIQRRFFSEGNRKLSVFLSHKHSDLEYLDSKWCNREIGFGDAHKYEHDKIAIFPIKQDDRQWSGNEYLQLYPSIEYFDGTTTYNTGETIPKGYYVYYHYENRITSLERWISK